MCKKVAIILVACTYSTFTPAQEDAQCNFLVPHVLQDFTSNQHWHIKPSHGPITTELNTLAFALGNDRTQKVEYGQHYVQHGPPVHPVIAKYKDKSVEFKRDRSRK
jgi:hypothetical protein